MKLQLRLMIAFLLLSGLGFAQTARLQVIHNSPTPTVDVYVNGTILLNDFAYRTATPYIDVPAGVSLSIAVAPGNSRSVADALATFPATLEAGKRYIAIAFGELGNRTAPFNLGFWDFGRETATTGNVGIAFFHGSPDAPAVDILAGGNVLFGNTSFGRFARPTMPYAEVPANATYRLAVTPAGTPNTVVAQYDANLSFWAGKTAIVMATGFLGNNTPDRRFEPWVVLSNGGTFPLNAIPAGGGGGGGTPAEARLQVIHNSPTPTVDIYVNGSLLLDNFAFRTATPYISVPAGVTLNVGVAPATSRSASDTIANFPVRLDAGKTYIAVAHGVVGNRTTPFSIAISDAGRMASTNPNNVDVNFFHGTPDAPPVSISSGTSTLFGNVAYSRFGNYISVPANATYTLGVAAAATPTNIIARYNLNLEFWKGRSAIVMATGFLGGGTTPFEPWVVLSNGGTFPLSALRNIAEGQTEVTAFAQKKSAGNTVLTVSPNPAHTRITVNFNLDNDSPAMIQLINVTGQVVLSQRFTALNKGSQNIELDVNQLRGGYYIVRLDTNDGVQSQKLMVQNN